MEDKVPIRPEMVSRLPKFGGRSTSGGTGPLSNGSTQPNSPSQDGKTAPSGIHPNGLIRGSSFSLKWKRDDGTTASVSTNPCDGVEAKAPRPVSSMTKEAKATSPGTPIMRRSGSLMVAVSSPKAIPKQSSKMSPKIGTKLGQSPLNGTPKTTQSGSAISAQTGSESRLVRPKLGCSSPRSISQDGLSQSSESLKTLVLDNMVRSNSFTHFKQIPSPSSQPITRSFSFNRAVELAKPLANTQLRPPRSSFLKPPQLSNGRVGLGLGGLNGNQCGAGSGGIVNLQYSRTPPASSSLPTPSMLPPPNTPNSLKKPLLPSCMLTKSVGNNGGPLGYRLTRPGQPKQQISVFPGRVREDVKQSVAPERRGQTGIALDSEPVEEAEKIELQIDSDGSSGNGGIKGEGNSALIHGTGQCGGQTLEDMSLSSASSLEKGDTSEECLDDFDSVGDVFSDGDLQDNAKNDSTTQTRLHSFLSDTIDWATVDLAEHNEESPMQDSQGPLALSPERADVCQAPSLELSPSNSSGGTYMWDEEGLEPIGGPVAHLCESFDDSDLNSMDILNKLDSLGPAELDDDDLMLDIDLPEDGMNEIVRMSHIEPLEKARRQGQRRKHLRWSGPDHFRNDRRPNFFQHYDGLRSPKMPSQPVPPENWQHEYVTTLDELTLGHMTQDCSSLKNQLLKLRSLLRLEDTDSPADVAEEIEEKDNTASQLEELIKEVQVLKEELRSRDKTIVQLTLQCQQLQREQMSGQRKQVRCQCHHQRAPSSLRQSDRRMDRRMHQHNDKATQTNWRPPNHAGVLPTPLLSPWQAQHQGVTCTSMPQRRQRVEHLVQYFTDRAWYSKPFLNMLPTCSPQQPPPLHAGLGSPRILQPFNPFLNEHSHQGKLAKTPPTEAHSDLAAQSMQGGAHLDGDRPLEGFMADVSALARPNELSHLLSTHLQCPSTGTPQKVTARDSPASATPSAAQREWRAHTVLQQNPAAPRPTVSLLAPQPSHLHKRASLPVVKQGLTGGYAPLRPGRPSGPFTNKTKLLPPPSRGLPCFNAGPQAQVPSSCRPSPLQQSRTSEPFKDPVPTSRERPNVGALKETGSAKTSLSRSCLPKPKIP